MLCGRELKQELLVTTLPITGREREVPWTVLRRVTGAVLVLVGVLIVGWGWLGGLESCYGLGVLFGGVGLSLVFDSTAESVALSAGAVVAAFIPFGLFVVMNGKNPISVIGLMYEGAFGSWFSFQNSLTRAAPLLLTGLCTAIPMRVGLVIIGGEGALVIGALMSAGAAHLVQGAPPMVVITTMLVSGLVSGGAWIMIAGALKQYRGVNATICSLLLTYIAVAVMNHMVEGPWRDPASLNKPSSWPIGDDNVLGTIPGMEVHWGLVLGLGACVVSWVLLTQTTFGFAASVVGGNVKAAKLAGLPLGRILLTCCFMGGAAAGLAGAIEVSAVQGSCNATVIAGYGYAGILVAFLARHNPMAIVPVAVLLGGIAASGGLLQRRLDMPDATVNVLQGMIFLVLLASESFYGKIKFLQAKEKH
jgi:simple sugar transport system permease protein